MNESKNIIGRGLILQTKYNYVLVNFLLFHWMLHARKIDHNDIMSVPHYPYF